jgi:anti-sigma B factor antagonist
VEVSLERVVDGVAIVSVSGEVDKNSSPKVRDTLVPLFAERLTAVVVDLSGVTYIDSSGIATLTEGLQLSHRGGIAFRLTGMPQEIKEVFEVARLAGIFEIYDTPDEALEGLA